MSIYRHTVGHEEPKGCKNCAFYDYEDDGNGYGAFFCHADKSVVDKCHGGQDCPVWEREED